MNATSRSAAARNAPLHALARAASLAAIAAACAGCGESGKNVVDFTGTPAGTLDAHVLFKGFYAPVTVGGTKLLSIADTGGRHGQMPSSLVDADDGDMALHDLQMGGVTFQKVSSLAIPDGVDEIPSQFGRVSGLVGTNVLAATPFTLDYRAQQLAFGEVSPADVADPVEVPLTTPQASPNSGDGPRAVVDIEVEGRSLRAMIDSGSPYLIVSQEIGDALSKDGRKTVSGSLSFAAGLLNGNLMRAKTVAMGGASVDHPLVFATADFLSLQTDDDKGQFDALIGADFLMHHAATFDFAKAKLTLRRYTKDDPFYDDGITFGFTATPFSADGDQAGVDPTVAALVVDGVKPGSAAAKQGVAVGDFILAIGDKTIEGLDISQVTPLLFAPEDGVMRDVTFGCPSGAAFSTCKTKARTISLPFEDDGVAL
jgi:hypothetical protein